jgi:hypothetical protein
MVERKKTGRAKARKGVSGLSMLNREEANGAVHLGQALIGCYTYGYNHAYITRHIIGNTPHPQSSLD